MSHLRRIFTSSTPRLILRTTTTTTTTRTPFTHRLNTKLHPSLTSRRTITMSHLPQLDGLQIEEQVHKADATRRTKRGDNIYVHYTGTLTNGKKFDSSHDRNDPLNFTVGSGQVITGWDEGLLGMAEGEKRKLTISPDLAYGARGMPPVIPPSATLIFETELVKIK